MRLYLKVTLPQSGRHCTAPIASWAFYMPDYIYLVLILDWSEYSHLIVIIIDKELPLLFNSTGCF